MKHVHAIAAILAFALVGTTLAQDKPAGQVPGELFFTVKNKQPYGLERVYPGITAALMLTDEQKTALYQSLDQTIQSEDLRAALQAVKSNPNATQAERAKAMKLMDEARAKLREAVKKVLKPEQLKLVDSIQQAFDEAQKVALQSVQAEFGNAKGNEARIAQGRQAMVDRTRTELAKRLEKILSADQKAAVEKAAAEQKSGEQ